MTDAHIYSRDMPAFIHDLRVSGRAACLGGTPLGQSAHDLGGMLLAAADAVEDHAALLAALKALVQQWNQSRLPWCSQCGDFSYQGVKAEIENLLRQHRT